MLERCAAYPKWEVALEYALIWLVVYAIIRFVQGTRAAGALKGFLVVLVLVTLASRVLGGTGSFQRLGLLYDRFLALVAIGLIVIFQPELRRALVRLGETPFLKGTPKDIKFVVDEISTACAYLAKAKFGAIIAVERSIGLSGMVEGGTVMNSELSSRLLQTIFFPGSALHDLAVVVRGRTIHSAGVQFPLAEPGDMPVQGLGSRHRAAVGLSKECDAVVVIVSEETGTIRIAERGRLTDKMNVTEFRAEFERRLTTVARKNADEPAPAAASPANAAHDPHDPNDASLAGHMALADDTPRRSE